MKLLTLFQLAPLATAIVLPTEQTFYDLSEKVERKASKTQNEVKNFFDHAWSNIGHAVDSAKSEAKIVKDKTESAALSAFDDALAHVHELEQTWTSERFDAQSWVTNNIAEGYDTIRDAAKYQSYRPPHDEKPFHDGPPRDGPPHHGPGHEEPPHHGPGHDKPDHGRPPHHRPGHHPHGPPNSTIYQLISESKYTTKLAKLINDYPDLVETLNGTKANYTIFAPIDAAFDKIPEHAPKPSKEQLKKLLLYHVTPSFYPAGRILVTHTIPTLLEVDTLAEKEVPQRVSVNFGLRGLTINFYSRVIGANLFATNGVIHGVDSFILPPPPVLKIISLVPNEFSTLELALTKTGLLDELDEPHKGGTFFAPSNFAFTKLGPRVNAFLFSKYGQKYLKALLKYHVVPKVTLYSDAIYGYESDDDDDDDSSSLVARELFSRKKCHKNQKKMDGGHHKVPKGYYHFDLDTLLEDKKLSVDVARYGGFIGIKINGFGRVVVQDGVARDGVIQVVGDVLIPPKKLPGGINFIEEDEVVEQGEISLEELKERLEPYVS